MIVCGIFWMFRQVNFFSALVSAQPRLNGAPDVMPIDLYSGGMQAR
jgi:hypothetical protein